MIAKRFGQVVVCMTLVAAAVSQAAAVETGPVDRKWGLGWDNGLTARLWLGGVWELGVAAGPQDYLLDSEGYDYGTGYPPEWDESESGTLSEDRTESGFVRVQAGRLVTRRGPLALVCFTGVQYQWSDGRSEYQREFPLDPDENYIYSSDYDASTWTWGLGLRPSFVVLDFLTIETAFGLEYRWFKSEHVSRKEFPETGQLSLETHLDDGNRFDDTGWTGMGSLQFIVWF
jgi:hypothetical protein